MEELLHNFPRLKQNSEKHIKNKPNKYDLCFAIPKGKKFFGWFTFYQGEPVFALVNKEKNKIYFKYTSFNIDLCNTIVYGTQFYYKSNETFCIEDVLTFQSNDVFFYHFKNKIPLLEFILNNIQCYQIEKSRNVPHCRCILAWLHCIRGAVEQSIFGLSP